MTFIDFIIKLAKDPKVRVPFINDLKQVNTKEELKLLLKKYKIKVTDTEFNKIWNYIKNPDNMANPITVKY